jgi:hypothetical protein
MSRGVENPSVVAMTLQLPRIDIKGGVVRRTPLGPAFAGTTVKAARFARACAL